ncbi:hypothetical protein HK405_006058, partial [Cladochytrium tenue]
PIPLPPSPPPTAVVRVAPNVLVSTSAPGILRGEVEVAGGLGHFEDLIAHLDCHYPFSYLILDLSRHQPVATCCTAGDHGNPRRLCTRIVGFPRCTRHGQVTLAYLLDLSRCARAFLALGASSHVVVIHSPADPALAALAVACLQRFADPASTPAADALDTVCVAPQTLPPSLRAHARRFDALLLHRGRPPNLRPLLLHQIAVSVAPQSPPLGPGARLSCPDVAVHIACEGRRVFSARAGPHGSHLARTAAVAEPLPDCDSASGLTRIADSVRLATAATTVLLDPPLLLARDVAFDLAVSAGVSFGQVALNGVWPASPPTHTARLAFHTGFIAAGTLRAELTRSDLTRTGAHNAESVTGAKCPSSTVAVELFTEVARDRRTSCSHHVDDRLAACVAMLVASLPLRPDCALLRSLESLGAPRLIGT